VLPTLTFAPPPSATPTPASLVECINIRATPETGTFCAGDSTCADWSGWTAGDPIPACMTVVVVCPSWPPPAGYEPCAGLATGTKFCYAAVGDPGYCWVIGVSTGTPLPPAAVPSLTPLTTATPTPTPLPSTADCTWAEGILTEDATLDSQEAKALADGSDTRYPASDASYYQGEAGEWTQIDAWVTSMCAGQPVSSADVQTALAWIQAAVETHIADAAKVPADAAWDSQWEANYARLEGLLQPAA
jgi:hypothetical protein